MLHTFRFLLLTVIIGSLFLNTLCDFSEKRQDFTFFNSPETKNLIYFDNAATTQKPHIVIQSLVDFYEHYCANIHRGDYELSRHATEQFEQARIKVARFVNAQKEEIIFTKGSTDGINFIASTWAMTELKDGDEILVTELEHNSNILPWLQVSKKTGAVVKIIPVLPQGELDMKELEHLLTTKTKLVALTHCSNAIGMVTDLSDIIARAHAKGARVLIDAAQSAPCRMVDVQELNPDFLVFSGHKLCGPTGIGVLYIKKELTGTLIPYQWGGGMVDIVHDFEHVELNDVPEKFEAGTPAIAQAIALGAAIDYVSTLDKELIKNHLANLCSRMIDGLENIGHVRILGSTEQLKKNGHVVSFIVENLPTEIVSKYLDQHGICVRTNKHCAHLLAHRLGYDSSIRASFYIYNTIEEVDLFINTLREFMNTQYAALAGQVKRTSIDRAHHLWGDVS